MVDKIDPICGMQGKLKAHGHYFCSKSCIQKYEVRKGMGKAEVDLVSKIAYAVLVAVLILGMVSIFTSYMMVFMGVFFIAIALLKMADWKNFPGAFSTYDFIAKRSRIYASVYPLIEFALGVAFLLAWQVRIAAMVTVFIMGVGIIGVGGNLLSKNKIQCVCLGTFIKIPLTKITLFEDALMLVMGILVLLY